MKIMILALIFITGCKAWGFPQYATNDEIIAESKKCTDAGMDYVQNGLNHVVCIHPKKVKP